MASLLYCFSISQSCFLEASSLAHEDTKNALLLSRMCTLLERKSSAGFKRLRVDFMHAFAHARNPVALCP